MMFASLVSVGLAQPARAHAPTSPQEMYTAWCAGCHAADGTGRVAVKTITVEPMDFTDCAVTSPEPDGDWEIVIAEGGPVAGLSSQMPGYGAALTVEQIGALVRYVRTFCTEPSWPIGNLNFSRPIFTEKAFPENEVVVLPTVSHGGEGDGVAMGLKTVYERRVGTRGHVEVGLPLQSVGRDGERAGGLGDVTMAAKYVLHASRASTRIVSGGLEVKAPTGRERSGLGGGTTVLEPFVSAGFALREFTIQAQFKVEVPTRDPGDNTEVVYNVYGGRDLSALPSTWSIGFEINGVDDTLAVTPQLRKGLTRTGALAAAWGVRIPVVNRQRQHTQWVGYLLWEYRDPVRAAP